MFNLSGTVALVVVTTLNAGSPEAGDPVGGSVYVDVEPGLRQVSVERARWEALKALAELEDPPVETSGPWAAEREVSIERTDEGVRVRVSWAIEAIEAGWLAGPLIGPWSGMRVESVTWRGRDVGVTRTGAGDEIAVELPARARGELKLVAFVPTEHLAGGLDGSVDLWLMPAVRGALGLRGETPEDRVPELVADGEARRELDGRFWAAEGQLSLRWVAPPQADDGAQQPLAVANSAVGLTFGDGEVRGRARVSWLLRQGQLERVSIDSAGLGRDLELAGPNVLEWSRSGDRIDIVLKEPAAGRIDVDLRWTAGLPAGDQAELPAPRVTPGQAYRSETFMQIARDGELEIVPKLDGWAAVARTELPDWAGGFIQGTATASYRSEGGGGRFELLRFVPLSGPPVMIDVAAYEIATTDEGRSMVQARYDVRNERASHLRLELPAGARMLGVRVNGEAVTPTRDERPSAAHASSSSSTDSWLIPLVRSLESVKGSLSFPVEVIFIAETEDWEKKEARELQLPALDAPVAVSRVRVYLPPRYQNRVDSGEHHRVDSFSEGEGITYGLGVGAGSSEVAQADELYRDALSAWMANDFDRAQSSLDELGSLGASSANIEGLQANIDLVQGRADTGLDVGNEGSDGQSAVVSRRIKAQARQRAVQDEITLRQTAEEAERLEAQGSYDLAEEKLAEAQEIGDRLALLEQSESKEQIVYNQSLSSSSARVAEKKKRKRKRESKAEQGKKQKQDKKPKEGKTKLDLEADKDFDPDIVALQGGEGVTVYDFEDDLTEGELLAPPPIAEPMPEPKPEPEPEPVSEYEPEPVVTVTTTTTEYAQEAEAYELQFEEARNLPVGADTSRDFTAVVEAVPGVMADDAGAAYYEEDVPDAGAAYYDEDIQMAPLAPSRSRRGGKNKSRKTKPSKAGKSGKGRKGKTNAAAPAGAVSAAAPDDAPPPPPPPADPNAALAGPVATASAVSVHIPAIGEAVLYQYMLLPEGEPLTVHLEARRHKHDKRR